MALQTKQFFQLLKVMVWVIFIGLCVKAGSLFFSFVFSLFVNPVAAQDLYLGLDLSALMKHSIWSYAAVMALVVLSWGLKAFLFYWLIKIFLKAKYTHPFTLEVARFISIIGYAALFIGVISILTTRYAKLLSNKGIYLSNLYEFTSGGFEFMLTAAIVFAIAQVFRRGIEIQSENELTI